MQDPFTEIYQTDFFKLPVSSEKSDFEKNAFRVLEIMKRLSILSRNFMPKAYVNITITIKNTLN